MVEKIVKTVYEAGKIILNAGKDKNVKEKTSNVDLVTEFDVRVQNFLFANLKKDFKNCTFLSEEGKENKTLEDRYCFIIDPIDGTTNFVKDFGHSAISVALAKDKEIVAGVVYDPFLNNMFYAEKGKGAFLNDEKIHASNCEMENSLVLFGTCPYNHELADDTFETAKKIFLNCIEVRRCGSAALDICYVASGKADLYFEYVLRPWDYAAGTLILEEAGGISMTLDKDTLTFDKNSSYLCGNKKNIDEFFKIIK